jgi:hypothetical protein
MRSVAFIASSVVAAIFATSTPALAFQEILEARQPEVSYGAAEPAAPSAALQSPGDGTSQATENKSTGLLNFGILPKLDIGLELLYGDEQQGRSQDPIADETGDVTVLGKVKRRF